MKKPGPIVRAVMETIESGGVDSTWRLRLPKRRGRKAKMSVQNAHYGNDDQRIAHREADAMERNERRRRIGRNPAYRAETDMGVL